MGYSLAVPCFDMPWAISCSAYNTCPQHFGEKSLLVFPVTVGLASATTTPLYTLVI